MPKGAVARFARRQSKRARACSRAAALSSPAAFSPPASTPAAQSSSRGASPSLLIEKKMTDFVFFGGHLCSDKLDIRLPGTKLRNHEIRLWQRTRSNAGIFTVTRKLPRLRSVNQLGNDRIQVDVPRQMNEVCILVHANRLEAPLKNRANALVAFVDRICVRLAERSHRLRESVATQAKEQ